MRAWVMREIEGPESFRLEEADPPQPGPGEVRVGLRAAGLNHLDLWVSRGLPKPELPHVAGGDGAGVVEAVGQGVEGTAAGDEVVINPSVSCGRCSACLRGDAPLCPSYQILGEHRWGTFAEQVVVPAVNVLPKPAGLSWTEAGAYGLSSGTALRMLRRARLQPADTLLVVGVGGGVSAAGMLIGLTMGARVFVTSRDREKISRAEEWGAEAGFSSEGEFSRELRDATDGAGVDVVLENVGPATWEESFRSLAPGGRLVTCGGTTGTTVEMSLPRLFFKQVEVIGSTMFDYAEFARITDLVSDGRVPVMVDQTFAFEDLPAALARLDAGEQMGKVVIRHD